MDRERFVQVLKENKGILFKVINTYCRDEDDRKDLEQEIVIQLWRSFKSYDSNYKLSTWVYRIAMNVSISFFRSNHTRKSRTSSISEPIFREIGTDSSSDEQDERKKFLYEFISQLDEFNKEILILYLEDYSYKEIAEIVGITESNVGTKINRIKKKLQEYFAKIKQ